MIKIERDFTALSEIHKNGILQNYKLIKKIQDKIQSSKGIPDKEKYFNYLFNNINTILSGEPDKLFLIINQINIDFTKNFQETIRPEIEKIFNYNKFVANENYGAYQLSEILNINVCPYCNRNYTTTYWNKGKTGRTRPTLDHFFDKATYPFLALSFWNLIPSCYVCNSQLKRDKKFDINSNLHPYLSGFENKLSFETDIYDINSFLNSSKKSKIKIKLKENKSNIELNKAKNNAETFKIEELYNSHTDYVSEIIQKSLIYNSECQKDLRKIYPDLTDEDFNRIILGNYVDEKNFENRPLAKLTHDIAEELGLLNI